MGETKAEIGIMSIVLDTNIFIDYTRDFGPAVDFFRRLNAADVYFSAITEAELLSGRACDDPSIKEGLLHILLLYEKVEVGSPIAQTAGDFAREHSLALPDAIIAATAFHTNSELITRNLKDFQKIKEIKVRAPY